MRATKQVSIKVEMLNFHFNTTLDYIINLSYRTADFMQAVILNLFAQTNQNFCHPELVSGSDQPEICRLGSKSIKAIKREEKRIA